MRPGPRGQHHAVVRRAARFGGPRRGASRGLLDEGLRRAGEPAGVQRGAGRIHAADAGAHPHRPAAAAAQLPRAGRHSTDDPPDLHRRGAGTGRHGQGVQLFLPAGVAGTRRHEHQERRGARRADRRAAGRGQRPLRGPDLCDAQPYRPGGDGLGNDHSGHAAAVVRLDVRRDGRHDHGRTAGRHAADGLRPAGGLRAVLQYPKP